MRISNTVRQRTAMKNAANTNKISYSVNTLQLFLKITWTGNQNSFLKLQTVCLLKSLSFGNKNKHQVYNFFIYLFLIYFRNLGMQKNICMIQQDQSRLKILLMSAMTSQTHSMQGVPPPKISSTHGFHSKDMIQSVTAAKISEQQSSQSRRIFVKAVKKPSH